MFVWKFNLLYVGETPSSELETYTTEEISAV